LRTPIKTDNGNIGRYGSAPISIVSISVFKQSKDQQKRKQSLSIEKALGEKANVSKAQTFKQMV